MRKLLNTLYVMSENYYLALNGETLLIFNNNEKIRQFPLHLFDNIISFSYKGASPALMGKCAQLGINLCFMSQNGHFLARACGVDRGNVLLRKNQYRISDDELKSSLIARNFILGKTFNSKWVIERTIRDHKYRVDSEKLKKVSKYLTKSFGDIKNAKNLQTLRGLEGESAKQYFSVLDDLIINQKEMFVFKNRNKRPPLDNINAMLSFGYSLLANDCASALESVGLDSYVGFLHRDKPGRRSLSLDLMEELRPIMVDRFVITLINTSSINNNHFRRQESGAVLLNEEGRKIFLNRYQDKKRERIQHPYLGDKVEWGLIPYIQALLLARYIRNDLDDYPPFFWK